MNNTDINILIVEDDAIAQMTLSRILQDMSYLNIQVSSDATTALKVLGEQAVDLLITDIFIKGSLTGIDLVREVNKLYDIPIIYLTASADPKNLELISQTRHNAVLEKPYDYDSIKSALQEAGCRP